MVDLNMTLIAQIVNFLILVAVLSKVAYKPLMKMLNDRQTLIANNIEQAEKDKAAAEQLRLEYQEQMKQAKAQAQSIIEKATKLADQLKDEVLAEAKAEHARLLKAAQEEISREQQRAVAELRNEVVSLSIAAATKIIGQSIDVATSANLVTDFINKLDDEKMGGLKC